MPMITEVATAYTYRDKAAVLAYLHDYPTAGPSLIEASRIIPLYFAGNPSVVLDVGQPPQNPERTRGLPMFAGAGRCSWRLNNRKRPRSLDKLSRFALCCFSCDCPAR